MNGEQDRETGNPRSPDTKPDTETLTRTLELLHQELARVRSEVDALRGAGAQKPTATEAEEPAIQAPGDRDATAAAAESSTQPPRSGPAQQPPQAAPAPAGEPARQPPQAAPSAPQAPQLSAEASQEPAATVEAQPGKPPPSAPREEPQAAAAPPATAPQPQAPLAEAETEAEEEATPPPQQERSEREGAQEPGEQETVTLFDGSVESSDAWAWVGAGGLERGEGEEGRATLRLRVERELGLGYYRQRQFANFRLHLQYRPDSPNSDSKLAVRFRDPAQPVPDRENPEVRHAYDNQAYVASHTGFEVRLGAGAQPEAAAGTFAGVPFGDAPGSQQHAADAELNPGDWNELTLEVRGEAYSVWVNGTETARFVSDDAYRGRPPPDGGFVGIVTRAAPEATKAAAPPARGSAPARRRAMGGPSMRPPPGPPPSWLTAPIIGGRPRGAARRAAGQRARGGAAISEAAGWLEIQRCEVEILGEAAEQAAPKERDKGRRKVLSAQEQKAIREEVAATKARLQVKDASLEPALQKAYAYAIVPVVGRAGLVVGVSHGYGEVFEQGKSIAFASVTQVTVGVQVGGQTFSEVLLFHSKESLEQFLRGTKLFNANLSAVFIRGASGTVDAKGVTIRAYSRGGMLLEASLGGQSFRKIDVAGEGEAQRLEQGGRKPREVLRSASSALGGAAKSALGFVKAVRAH